MKDSSIKVYKQEDILDLINCSTIERAIIKDIISTFTSEAASGISKNQIVQIPYLFNIRKSLYQEEFAKKKKLLRLARQYKSKEEYKDFCKEVSAEARQRAFEKDRLNIMIRKAKTRYKKHYEKLVIKCGKQYADAWILSRCCFRVIPFDEDVEFALQTLWEKENET